MLLRGTDIVNSVEQTAPDQCLHCVPMPACPKLMIISVYAKLFTVDTTILLNEIQQV